MKFVFPIAAAALVVSCASKNPYDTQSSPAPVNAPNRSSYGDTIYSSQAAYGDDAVNPPAPSRSPIPTTPPEPSYTPSPAPSVSQPTRGSIIHVVSKGDTLSGLATKYQVPMASIKAANNMTTDTVVLGRKMTIPAR